MPLSRRDFLKLASLFSASATLNACVPIYQNLTGNLQTGSWAPISISDFTALNRITFGARIEERAHLAEIGLRNFIEEQLAPESINDVAMELQLSPFKTLGLKANEIEAVTNQLFDGYDRERPVNELRQATILRQLYSKRQLHEVMAEFWSDHFNIYIEKGNGFYLKTVDDREVIRKHTLGNFRDLVWASAHSPAMLAYLDNQANIKGTPNENYARELMELHTLSVNSGYSQQDVMELARCLTGWSIKEHFWLGDFVFRKEDHEPGVKNVLSLTIPESGQAEAEQVIEHIALHPDTARFICTKLARRFIADDPPVQIIEKAAQTFLSSRGDIQSVLRVILLDGLAFAQPKYKRPLNFVLSALRMLNAQTDGSAVQDYLLRMGQLPFNWTTPDGYPDHGDAWQGNLMPRWQFAFALILNEIPKTKHDLSSLLAAVQMNKSLSPASDIDSLASLLLGSPLEPEVRSELLDAIRSAGTDEEELLPIITASLIASPAFQWR